MVPGCTGSQAQGRSFSLKRWWQRIVAPLPMLQVTVAASHAGGEGGCIPCVVFRGADGGLGSAATLALPR